jgi:hypothetical protein
LKPTDSTVEEGNHESYILNMVDRIAELRDIQKEGDRKASFLLALLHNNELPAAFTTIRSKWKEISRMGLESEYERQHTNNTTNTMRRELEEEAKAEFEELLDLKMDTLLYLTREIQTRICVKTGLGLTKTGEIQTIVAKIQGLQSGRTGKKRKLRTNEAQQERVSKKPRIN